MKILSLHKFISTAGGLGFIPFAPGTFGALGALLSGIAFYQFTSSPSTWLICLILIFFFLGVYSSNKLIPIWGKDPKLVVIDEVIGMWISMLLLPNNLLIFLLAFGLFRLFDIFKPLYIKNFEKLKHGWGIMMDDVIAGLYANIVIQVLLITIKCF